MSGRLIGRRQRRGDERGAVIVELAMVVPILLTLVLGMYEIGMAWGASQTVVQASRGGARTASQLGTFGSTDQQALLAVLATFEDDVDDIQRVVVFDASGGPDLPPACDVPSSPAGQPCNIYRSLDFAAANDPLHFDSNGTSAGCGTGASSNWCPDGDRSDSQLTATELGVFVEFEAERASRLFGSTPFTITRTTVMRIEPRET
jgi:hypothetical protein